MTEKLLATFEGEQAKALLKALKSEKSQHWIPKTEKGHVVVELWEGCS